MKRIVSELLYVWQFPQNLLGLCFLLFFTDEKKILSQRGTVYYTSKKMRGGISLGQYIFLSTNCICIEPVYDHEYGHCVQSRYLGWFYLPTVGLCSVLHAAVCRAANYYHFWTERWANSLGGIPGYAGEYHYHKDGVIITAYDKLREFYNEYMKK